MGPALVKCNPGRNPAIDRRAAVGEIRSGLQNTPATIPDESQVPRRRRKWKRWALLAGFTALAFWFNGPGFRWLVPWAAQRWMADQGLHGNFRIEGSLVGGFSIADLHLESAETLARLNLKRLTPVYQLPRVLRGEIDGLVLDGLDAGIRLEAKPEEDREASGNRKTKEAPDLKAIAETLRQVREKVRPVAIDLRNVSVELTRDGQPFLKLEPSALSHRAGADEFELRLGALTDAAGRQWPSQTSAISWKADELRIGRMDPLPGIGLRDLTLRLPGGGEPSLATELAIDEAVLEIECPPGFTSANVNLREGAISVPNLLGRFGIDSPVTATLTSLSFNADSLLPEPLQATGDLRVLLENASYDGWEVPELSVDLALDESSVRLAASGQALGTGFSLDGESTLVRQERSLVPGPIQGRFNVADLSKLATALAPKVAALDPENPLPPSMLDGTCRIDLRELKPASASVDLVLKPGDPKAAASIALKAAWEPEKPVRAEIASEGISAEAGYDTAAGSYNGRLTLKDFTTARIQPWLTAFRVAGVDGLAATGVWMGSGSVSSNSHQGSFDLAQLTLTRPETPALKARGGVDYQWPGPVSTKGLLMEAGEQKISLDAKLADGWLRLDSLRWSHKERVMAGGSIGLPVPADLTRWREAISSETRALAVKVDSEVLPLSLLKDWVPAASKLDARSTGRLSIQVAGTFADPVVDASLDLKELRSPEQPKLPPADLRIRLAGKNGRISLDGSVLAPGYQPATLTASMPFRPSAWAEQPEVILKEALSARVDLPRLDLSRFSSLVPAARTIRGVLTGNVVAAGEIGKPELKGRLDLTAGGLEFADASLPPVTGAGAALDLSLDRLVLRDLKATIAGGTLQGGGNLSIVNGAPGPLDFRLTGRHLPVKRDDSLIVRADADLRLAGTWTNAALTGSVGIVDSLFYRDIELLPIGTPFTTPSAASLPKLDAPARAVASAVPEPFRNWTVNVLARTVNPFLIRGNFATGRIDANLRVGGTFGKPAPDGEVKISDLKAALPFSTLTVRSGTLRFTPATGFDPILEIRGRAEPRPYRVNAYVYGPASNPQLVLTSTPPLPENEIMTLLATGTTTTGLEDPQAASSRAMQLLAEELRRGRFAVGKRLRPLLGLLDRVDFSVAEADPYTSESFSTATLAVTDNWFVSAGMGAEGDSRVLGIWRISFR